MTKNIPIAWYGLHFGEEPPISGTCSSGTIFFCHCNLKCVFCQNWQISSPIIEYKKYSIEEIVEIMFELEKKNAHNINLITPTPWKLHLKKIIQIAKNDGLKIPIVWNSNGHESVGDLNGLVDIYLPDYKYSDDDLGLKYSGISHYSETAKKAILEMQKQVGDLQVDENGVAKKGLIVRHLVLPEMVENSIECLKFIRSVSNNIHLSLMSQYNPTFKAKEYPEINRNLTIEEYQRILKEVEDLGFKNGWVQEFGDSVKCLNPDFTKENPFT